MIEYQLLIIDDTEGPMLTRMLSADDEHDVLNRKIVAEHGYSSACVYIYERVDNGQMVRRKDIEAMNVR